MGCKISEDEGAMDEFYNHGCLPKGLNTDLNTNLKVIMQSPRKENPA